MTAQGIAHLTVVAPGITVTKKCVTTCPRTDSTPIQFGGTIYNTGDISLTNVIVSDSHAGATITYSTASSLGSPFPATGGGRLASGDSLDYFGSFDPTRNGCGPFPDTIVACGTDQSSIPKTVCATNSDPLVLPRPESVEISPPRLEGRDLVFSFQTATNRSYTVWFTDSLSPEHWQMLQSLPGIGDLVTVRHSITNTQGFYRALAQ